MAVSTNGWAFIRSSLDPRLRTITIPGTTKRLTLRRVVAPLFAAFLADVHDLGVLDLQKRQDATGAWNPRETASGALSNHGSGTAVDMRWDLLPADGQRHMTDQQIKVMHRLLDRYAVTRGGKRVFGWGGDYRRTVDEMHLEIGQAWQPGVGSAVTRADVIAVKKRLKIDKSGVRHLTNAGNPRKRRR